MVGTLTHIENKSESLRFLLKKAQVNYIDDVVAQGSNLPCWEEKQLKLYDQTVILKYLG